MPDPRAVHQLQLLCGSQAFFDVLVQSIDASVFEVRLETYIFDVHGCAEQVALALANAARRGVSVFLLVDGVGTPQLPKTWHAQFAEVGVHWRMYSPLGRLGLLVPSRWRRLHRKLCVVDGDVAFCGGINVLDDWFDPNYGDLLAPRLDFAVCVQGPLVKKVHAAMAQLWWRLDAVQSAKQVDWNGAWQALQKAVRSKKQSTVSGIQVGHTKVELVLRDNLRNRTRIERAYRHALGEARHEVILANAYFLPGRKMRQALMHAARRGVRVRLLLQGQYEYFMQYHATHALYGPLLAAGIEVYEYKASFLHAKVAVIDGRWATVGSSNMDPLSLLLAREANVVVDDPVFAQTLRVELERAMMDGAQLLDRKKHFHRRWREKLFDHAALLLMRVLLLINGRRY